MNSLDKFICHNFISVNKFYIYETEFRNALLKSLSSFQQNKEGGLFINSCFIHCQTWFGETWHSPSSPRINNKVSEAIALFICSRAPQFVIIVSSMSYHVVSLMNELHGSLLSLSHVHLCLSRQLQSL